MGRRGRQSKTSLTVEPGEGGAPQRRPAPADLCDRDRQRWDQLVSDWPADHWRESDLHLLRSLVITERMFSEVVDRIELEGYTITTDNGKEVVNPAVTVHGKMAATIIQLQRALRLSPITRTRSDSASLRGSRGAKRPWES